MAYAVKEIFFSLQGEGFHAGRTTIFCRFSGCNLWSGLEKSRFKAICQFCDTDFVGTDGTFGGKYKNAEDLVQQMKQLWPASSGAIQPYVVFTGGEPMLQVDAALIRACRKANFIIGIETNGTKEVIDGIDWICVSPKPHDDFKQQKGHELKLVYPQKEERMKPHHFANLDFKHFYLQPMDGPNVKENTESVIAYCLQNPQWKVSLQMHKMLGVR